VSVFENIGYRFGISVYRLTTSPYPEFGVGDANSKLSSRFCSVSKFQAPDCSKHQHVSTKTSVLWPSKYIKMYYRSGLSPGPLGSSPDPIIGWKGASVPKLRLRRSPCAPPHQEFQPYLRLCHNHVVLVRYKMYCSLGCYPTRQRWLSEIQSILQQHIARLFLVYHFKPTRYSLYLKCVVSMASLHVLSLKITCTRALHHNLKVLFCSTDKCLPQLLN